MKGEWILIEPTDCFTLLPIYECSKCKKTYSGYEPEPFCENCGSKNKLNTKKYIKKDIFGAYNQMLEEKADDLENKIINLEQENFELRQKLNTEEECCVRLGKKIIEQAEIIKSLAKALEDKGIDLSHLIFSYLTPDEWLYVKNILPNFRSEEDG